MDARAAAGFVIAHVDGAARRYLLLRNAAHGTWAPPKGHSEGDETAVETARRETLEETGLDDLSVVEDFAHVIEYDVRNQNRGSYRKRVTYFLATTPKAAHVQSSEHDASGWYSLAEAQELLSHPDLRAVLQAAEATLARRYS